MLSWVWTNIITSWDILAQHDLFYIGDGKTIDIFCDPSIPGLPKHAHWKPTKSRYASECLDNG